MEAIKETTTWRTDYQPNHIYLIDGSKMVAYIPFGTGEAQYFKSPYTFDRKGRTFEKVKPNPFKSLKSDKIPIQGSNNKTYYVDPDTKTCTCPGFTFRGDCKHIKPYI